MAPDRYRGFKELKDHEVADRDYRIVVRDIGSPVTVIAPHGGRIEPNTAEIVRKIADDCYNFYCFEGIKAKNNASLHITSHRFDEPRALKLISGSTVVVSVHARTGNHATVYLGGLDDAFKAEIGRELTARGIRTADGRSGLQGRNPDNICNRGRTRKGVQLEISRDLRDDPEKRSRIAAAVRAALARFVA